MGYREVVGKVGWVAIFEFFLYIFTVYCFRLIVIINITIYDIKSKKIKYKY